MFGDFVHALGAYLHLDPFVLGAFDGDVQTFVAVALGHSEPVAQAFQIAFVFVGYEREHFPALFLLLLERRVENDAYGKQVVHPIKAALLLLHLLPNGVYTLCAPLHVVTQSFGIEHFADRSNKVFDISIAGPLCSIKVLLNHIVGIVLQVFEAEVLKFTL